MAQRDYACGCPRWTKKPGALEHRQNREPFDSQPLPWIRTWPLGSVLKRKLPVQRCLTTSASMKMIKESAWQIPFCCEEPSAAGIDDSNAFTCIHVVYISFYTYTCKHWTVHIHICKYIFLYMYLFSYALHFCTHSMLIKTCVYTYAHMTLIS